MKKSLLCLALALSGASSWADVLASWTFETAASTNNIVGAGLSTGTTQSGVLADIGTGFASASHASAATVWSIPAGNGSLHSWSANTWAVNDYFQFRVPTLGYVDLQVSFGQVRSNTGVTNWIFQYSTDGSTFSPFSSYSVTNTPGFSSATFNSALTYAFDLSAIDSLENLPAVYFRLSDNNATAAGGTSRVDDFTVSASAVPEPSGFALVGMGLLGFISLARKR